MNIGRLVIAVKKNKELVWFKLPSGEKIRVLIKDHDSGNRNLNKLIIDCPKDIEIDREIYDEAGNC